ncbi:MAG: hypothetical protein PHS14_17790 [Elusimicrobia bacterium]|nr:hypothetical protein [Elusimicrobiota bacterium]
MGKTTRSKASTVRLLVSLVVFLTAALPPSVAAQVAVAAFRPPLPFVAPPALAELDAHGRELQLHLDGRKPARLEFISGRVEELKRRLAAGLPAAEEPSRVRLELARVGALLDRALGRTPAAAPRSVQPAQARAAAAAVAGILNGAAAAPKNPARFFDGSSVWGSRSVFSAPVSPAAAAPAASDASASSRPRLPAGYGSDLNILVPAPYAAAAAAPAPDRRPNAIVFLSKRVARTSDAAGKVLSYEAGVADLLLQKDAESRTALSREIARELLSALRKPDAGGVFARELGDFLRDIAEYRPLDAIGARLSADGRNHFRLIFERADKSRRVIMGQFLPGTARDGKPSRMAFIIMGAVEMDAAGVPHQNNPGYWREYAADGSRLEWSTTSETEEKGWGPWAHRNELASSWLTAKAWGPDGWSTTAKEKVKTAQTKAGLSWFGRTEGKIMTTPVVGSALKFCDQVAAGLYTAVVGAPQIIMADLSGSDMYSLEAGGSYAKNPLVNLLLDDKAHLARLTPGARKELYGKVDESRRRALDSSLIPLAPEVRWEALSAPVSDREAVSTLRDNYGASTYGKRLIHASTDLDGWRSAAMKIGGVAAGAFENVAEGVCNPILWVTLGAGEAVTAIKGSEALASGAIGAKAALTAVQAVHAGATVAWWAPWLLSGTDNLGKVARLTTEGQFDKEYFGKLGDAGADFLYMFAIP